MNYMLRVSQVHLAANNFGWLKMFKYIIPIKYINVKETGYNSSFSLEFSYLCFNYFSVEY